MEDAVKKTKQQQQQKLNKKMTRRNEMRET